MILFVDSTMSPFFFIALTTAANLVKNDNQEIQNSDQNNEVVEILIPVYNNIHSNSWNGHQIVPSDDNIDNDDDEDQTWVTKKHFYYIV